MVKNISASVIFIRCLVFSWLVFGATNHLMTASEYFTTNKSSESTDILKQK